MEVHVKSLQEFISWVGEFKKTLNDKQLILLSGPMGAGKTQFVQSLIGDSANVMSPTFAIHNKYELETGSVDHVDLYRLEDDRDLESTGFWDIFEQQEGWVLIEWADRLPDSVYPLNWPAIKVNIKPVADNATHRKITIN